MKILLVNTFDRGGAAHACLRLHEGLLRSGIPSKVLLKEKQKQAPQVFCFQETIKNFFSIQKIAKHAISFWKSFDGVKELSQDERIEFIESRDQRLEYFSFPYAPYDITASTLYKEADIVHLHWVADFLDYTTFFQKNTKPVVWTLHDMNPFSGGEHYEEKYMGIDEKAYPVDRILSNKEKEVFKRNIAVKQQALRGVDNLHIVTLCTWMQEEVKKSSLFKKYPSYIIPNGIDSSVFIRRDRIAARKLLKLPLEKKIILFVADSIDKSRKGFAFLQKAFDLLETENIILCSVGGQLQSKMDGHQYIALGTIDNEITMSHVYSAADVFVIPSLMDNLPNTVLESLMCGTPVIGFPVGGVVDMIQHGKNGYLTEKIGTPPLLKALQLFLSEENIFDTQEIREDALSKYNQTIQAEKYIQLFNSILSREN